jgi:hypothetical protein
MHASPLTISQPMSVIVQMSTSKRQIDGDEEISVLHDYESTIYRAKVRAR